jgi:hypothetical protein
VEGKYFMEGGVATEPSVAYITSQEDFLKSALIPMLDASLMTYEMQLGECSVVIAGTRQLLEYFHQNDLFDPVV